MTPSQPHLHILGIGGTFMGGVAVIAKEMGYRVSGSDKQCYPPMSTQLAMLGIEFIEGYHESTLSIKPDVWLIGNGISRGNPLLEAILESNALYQSAPQWLYEQVLRHRHVVAIAGTHGKTTSTAMTVCVLDTLSQHREINGVQGQCGYLIGGVAKGLPHSARLGNNPYFVIEADEYDTALFDKRSKFVHYHPRTLILNNLEFDHADIFPNLSAIETQCHHVVRTMPRSGRIIANAQSEALKRVRDKGVFCDWQWFNSPESWHINAHRDVYCAATAHGTMPSAIIGEHNRHNALAVCAALNHINVPPSQTLSALAHFSGVKRRLEWRATLQINPTLQEPPIELYDDFAHHPTAIHETLSALRERLKAKSHHGRIIAVVEPRSNTMKMGVFATAMASALAEADIVVGYGKNLGWDLSAALQPLGERFFAPIFSDIEALINALLPTLRAGDVVIGMSNGGFDGFYEQFIARFDSANP